MTAPGATWIPDSFGNMNGRPDAMSVTGSTAVKVTEGGGPASGGITVTVRPGAAPGAIGPMLLT